MKQKIIAAVLAAAMLAPFSVRAEEWIELSAWSYNEVSGFVSEGLLPDSMKGISNYKREINRGEFCTLLYSVLKKSGILTSESYDKMFNDCDDYPYANRLARVTRVESSFDKDDNNSKLYPEDPASRLWAAEIIGNVLISLGIYDYDPKIPSETIQKMQSELKDYDEIKDFTGVGIMIDSGIMSDMDDGCFHGNDSMTIEQAVSVIYRMYKKIPRVITSDNEDGEVRRGIGAGLTEEIAETYYNIKSGDDTVMSLEKDVYSKVLAADYNGSKLIFAVNFNDKTDVFDASSSELLYTIPYIVNEVNGEKGYAYTLSGRFMPCYTGIYGMDNTELLTPEYSRAEADAIAANGMEIPIEKYRVPDGFIYYADWNNGGHMYRVDSNGENNQLIVSGLDCTNLQYLDGKIYFNDNKAWGLHSVNPDGTGLTDITKGRAFLYCTDRTAMYPYIYDEYHVGGKDIFGFYELSGFFRSDDESYLRNVYTAAFSDGSLLYYTYEEDAMKRQPINGQYTDYRSGYKVFRYTPDGQSIPLADFYINNIFSSQNGDGKLYFQNEEELYTTGESPIYVNDNGELKCISGDYKAASFGFGYNHETNKVDTSKIAFITQDEVLKGTYHLIDLATGEITQEPLTEKDPRSRESEERYYYKNLCNDELSVWIDYNDHIIYNDSNVYIEYNGKVTNLGAVRPLKLCGDILYYSDSDHYFHSSLYRGFSNSSVKSLNYKTGEIKNVGDGFSELVYNNSDMILYQTSLGGVKRSENGEPAVTVFPNKSIFRYGEVDKIAHMPKFLGEKDCLYKIDKDGNISKLTDTDSKNALYIPNDGGNPMGVY
ncbi:MAG: DUF5050 domain-containing protein [Oscillospiraceae bacterium]|nr:DUF5050 domain-containing protein [Oscillospiraceae bacterium]